MSSDSTVVSHKLKIAPEYFEAQKKGIKKFEIRKNDRDFKVGDLIELAEFKDGKFTDRTLLCQITYITDYAQQPGYVVFGTSSCIQLPISPKQEEQND